jgi:hypothetical protein
VAVNTVCADLDEGQPYQTIVAELETYSRYSPIQAHTYIAQSAAHYCPNNAGKPP